MDFPEVTLETLSLRVDKAPDSFDETEDFPLGRLTEFELMVLGPEVLVASLTVLLELE